MGSTKQQQPKQTKPTSQPQQQIPQTSPLLQSQTPNTLTSSSSTSHLAMVELKQKILTSLSKLSDRDTHQIAILELEALIKAKDTLVLPMLLTSLLDSSSSSSDPKPAVKKQSLRLISLLCASHPNLLPTHLSKIISHIARRLRDPDAGVREACKESMGEIFVVYVRNCGTGAGGGGEVGLFVKPLFEGMGENGKGVQMGAALCLGRIVECCCYGGGEGVGGNGGFGLAFQKVCGRVCKFLNSPNFFAKAALLSVVGPLSQVGAITPQTLEPLLQGIHECLASTDWATRKAAAEALMALALHSSDLVKDGAISTLTALDACRFDKIKPVRDSVTDALQLWKKVAGKAGDGILDNAKKSSHEHDLPDKDKQRKKQFDQSKVESLPKDSSVLAASVADSGKSKRENNSDLGVEVLKKKLPLTDMNMNPEFFQKLEKRGPDELPVEVVVPRKCLNPSNSGGSDGDPDKAVDKTTQGSVDVPSSQQDFDTNGKEKCSDHGLNGKDTRTRQFSVEDRGLGFTKAEGLPEGSVTNGKGNWLAIQRQLLHLERQQSHLMDMLQQFMGGSHDSMVTLENRVRGLERVVEDMVHDLSLSSGRRGGSFRSGYEGSSNRSGRYVSYLEYGGRLPYGDRFPPSEGVSASMRSRGPSWRSDLPEPWDSHSFGASKNGQVVARRDGGGNSGDGRSPRSDHESDQVSSRRAWDKGPGNVRLGEGPSARSVWQASKDEATLAAIRVAGEDNGIARTARVAVREREAEGIGNDNNVPERDPIWTSWSNAMDAVEDGDMDTAYAEVLSTGDDALLVKLMDRSGPVFDQLSNELAAELLNAIVPYVVEQNLYDLCLSWIQQLLDLIMENGPDVFGISIEVKKELLFNMLDASSALELPEDWDGMAPDQLMLQLASAWDIDLQQPGS